MVLRLVVAPNAHGRRAHSSVPPFPPNTDLFVTVVAPSKRFDQLADDFDHQLVAAVLGALVVGALLLSRMAHTKRIKTLWK